MSGLSIGEVAERSGISASALRYYERSGLIAPQVRVSGQRRFDVRVFDELALIGYAKAVGFTVAEIKVLLSGTASAPGSARWRALAIRKRAELDTMIDRTRRMKRLLNVALRCRCLDLDECGRRLRSGGH